MNAKEALEAGRDAFLALDVWYRGDGGPPAPRVGTYGCMVTTLPFQLGRRDALRALYEAARDRHPDRVPPSDTYTLVLQRFNDDPRTTKAEADAVYVEAVERV